MHTEGLKFSKPRPRALDKEDRAKTRHSTEEIQNALVKARSGGQCEVRLEPQAPVYIARNYQVLQRCGKRAFEIHHLLGGSGRRGVKESALATNKLHVCGGFAGSCHDLITRHVLQPHWTDVNDRAGTIYFVRLT